MGDFLWVVGSTHWVDPGPNSREVWVDLACTWTLRADFAKRAECTIEEATVSFSQIRAVIPAAGSALRDPGASAPVLESAIATSMQVSCIPAVDAIRPDTGLEEHLQRLRRDLSELEAVGALARQRSSAGARTGPSSVEDFNAVFVLLDAHPRSAQVADAALGVLLELSHRSDAHWQSFLLAGGLARVHAAALVHSRCRPDGFAALCRILAQFCKSSAPTRQRCAVDGILFVQTIMAACDSCNVFDACMAALRSLIGGDTKNTFEHDTATAFEQTGGFTTLLANMSAYLGSPTGIASACSTLNAFAWDEPLRDTLGKLNAHAIVLDAMKAHASDAAVQCFACRVLRSLALSVELEKAIIAIGGQDHIMAALRAHPNDANVQEFGCGAIRNISGQLESRACSHMFIGTVLCVVTSYTCISGVSCGSISISPPVPCSHLLPCNPSFVAVLACTIACTVGYLSFGPI